MSVSMYPGETALTVTPREAYSRASGKPVSFFTGIAHGTFTFFRIYVLRLGFLDGAAGFLLAVANAEGTYYRYMKAWLARQRRE